jgi:galactokinase
MLTWRLATAATAGAGLALYLYYKQQAAKGFKCTVQELQTLASTDDSARVALLKALFAKLYGAPPEQVALAGGRVNLIGEHVDYPDVQFAGKPVVHLFSMGGAIQNNYLAAAAKRTDGKIVLCHTNVREVMTVSLDELKALESAAESDRKNGVPMEKRSTPVWAQHTLGAVMLMLSASVPCTGLSLLLTSNVPHGAGMSNSAANCVALGLVFHALFPSLGLDSPIKLVTFARRCPPLRWIEPLIAADGH